MRWAELAYRGRGEMEDDGGFFVILLALLAFIWWMLKGPSLPGGTTAAGTLYDAQHNLNLNGTPVYMEPQQSTGTTYQFADVPVSTLENLPEEYVGAA